MAPCKAVFDLRATVGKKDRIEKQNQLRVVTLFKLQISLAGVQRNQNIT